MRKYRIQYKTKSRPKNFKFSIDIRTESLNAVEFVAEKLGKAVFGREQYVHKTKELKDGESKRPNGSSSASEQ